MKNARTHSIRFAAAVLLAVSIFLIAGCSDDSTVAPDPNNENTDPPPGEVKTPVKMRINYVMIETVAPKKDNGDDWDLDPFSAAPRRPDIFFKLGNYTTNVITNYDYGREDLKFSAPNYGQMNYDGVYSLQLFDEDGVLQGANDLIGEFIFRPDAYYRGDNAERFTIRVLHDGKFSGWAYGVWIY